MESTIQYDLKSNFIIRARYENSCQSTESSTFTRLDQYNSQFGVIEGNDKGFLMITITWIVANTINICAISVIKISETNLGR